MDRRITLVVLGLTASLMGCQTQGGVAWPNLFAGAGPQRIPPPSTGTVASGNNYYPTLPQTAAPLVAPPVVQSSLPETTPAPTLATAANESDWQRLDEPIGSGVRTPSPSSPLPVQVVSSAPPIRVETASGANILEETSELQPATFRPPSDVRPLDPPTNPGYAEPGTGALPLRGFQARNRVPAPTLALPEENTALPEESAIAVTSMTEPTLAVSSTERSIIPRYGYSPDYRTLSGRLEYSQAEQRWKLRYIPYDAPNGQMDSYGGSVSLDNSEVLNGHAAGDFVVISGQLGSPPENATDFAPTFRVEQVGRSQ